MSALPRPQQQRKSSAALAHATGKQSAAAAAVVASNGVSALDNVTALEWMRTRLPEAAQLGQAGLGIGQEQRKQEATNPIPQNTQLGQDDLLALEQHEGTSEAQDVQLGHGDLAPEQDQEAEEAQVALETASAADDIAEIATLDVDELSGTLELDRDETSPIGKVSHEAAAAGHEEQPLQEDEAGCTCAEMPVQQVCESLVQPLADGDLDVGSVVSAGAAQAAADLHLAVAKASSVASAPDAVTPLEKAADTPLDLVSMPAASAADVFHADGLEHKEAANNPSPEWDVDLDPSNLVSPEASGQLQISPMISSTAVEVAHAQPDSALTQIQAEEQRPGQPPEKQDDSTDAEAAAGLQVLQQQEMAAMRIEVS